jgi:t-SNARE complex subunit (syntaxin)
VIQIFRLLGGAHSLRRAPKSEIIKLQLQMEEKDLKNRMQGSWHHSFQMQLDNLKTKIESAQTRFEHLREEYRTAASNYAHHSMERMQEMKYQMRVAKIEARAALQQWRAFNRFAKQSV